MKKRLTLLITAAVAIGSTAFQASAEEFFRSFSGGTASGVSRSGKYAVGYNDNKGIYMGPSKVFGLESHLWDTATGEKIFSTTADYEALEKSGTFLGVNDAGTVVGYYKNSEYKANCVINGEPGYEPINCAAYWEDGEVHPLGIGPVDLEKCVRFTDGTQAIAISQDGKTIIGTYTEALIARPCKWTQEADGSWLFQELPVLTDEGVQLSNVVTTGMSDDGSVISGYAELTGKGSAAVFWINDVMFQIPINYTDLDDPNKPKIENKAWSVSANGEYIGVSMDKTIPAVYSVSEGTYRRAEFSADVRINVVKKAVVNDLGDAVYSVNPVSVANGKESTFIYKRDLDRTIAFDYYATVYAPNTNAYRGNDIIIGVDNTSHIFTGSNAMDGGWSFGISDDDIELPAQADMVACELKGLHKVDISWPAANNTAKDWNLTGYSLYQNGRKIADIPYAPYATQYLYPLDNASVGYNTYYLTCNYQNESGKTIESPRSDMTNFTVAENFSFPLHSFGGMIWWGEYWTETHQIQEAELDHNGYGRWQHFGFDSESGFAGILNEVSFNPYSFASESRPIDATDVEGNIMVSFPRRYIIQGGSSTDFSNEYLSIDVSTDFGKTWETAKTWRGDEIDYNWDFDCADITDLARGKLFQVRIRRHGEGQAQFCTLMDYINIDTEIGDAPKDLMCFEKNDGDMQLVWKNNFDAYELNYMGNAYGNAFYRVAANAGKPFIAANHYDATDLAPYNGKYLSGVTTVFNWFDTENQDNAQINAKILVWEDGQLVRQQQVADVRVNEFYMIRLDEPVKIDASKSLRVGIEVSDYPASEQPIIYVNSLEYVNGKSDLFSEDGGKTWGTLEQDLGPALENPDDALGSWYISANITDEPSIADGKEFDSDLISYIVLRDGEKANDKMLWKQQGRFTISKEDINGDKDYQVRAVYKKQGVGPVSEKITVKDYSGVADTASDAEGVSITRRGRNIIINGDFISARLYAPDGRMVRSVSQPDLSLEGLQSGIFLLTVETGEGTKTFKFAI